MSDAAGFGATGDGTTDDTQALQHALDDGDGLLVLQRGDYRITRTLLVDLSRTGRTGISGSGGTARLLMDGPGPAVFLKGSHTGTADPTRVQETTWQQERMPIVADMEIVGRHPEADGIRVEGIMQPLLKGLLVRRVRHGIHLTNRARNVIVDHCHVYHNTGAGVFLDGVNLHQINVTGCHISYCRLGGIRVEKSEIRNLQITGNDLEYNNNRTHQVPDADDVPTAEIFLDVREGSVREGTIASNTIQATASPHGANIRMIGPDPDHNRRVGMWTISGNLIGSQSVNTHLTAAWGVTIVGNHFYNGFNRNILVEQSRNIVIGANCFGQNPDYGTNRRTTGIRLVDSEDCVVSGVLLHQHSSEPPETDGNFPRQGLLEVIRCRRVNISGTHVVDAAPYGLFLDETSDTLITGCTVIHRGESGPWKAAMRWQGAGHGNMIAQCRLTPGTEGAIVVDHELTQQGILIEEAAR